MYLHIYYPIVIPSDIHLGTQHSRTEEVTHLLKSISCDCLTLNGDIVDGWYLQKSGLDGWKAKHTDLFKVIMKIMENFGAQVICVRGNHDDFLDNLAPSNFCNV